MKRLGKETKSVEESIQLGESAWYLQQLGESALPKHWWFGVHHRRVVGLEHIGVEKDEGSNFACASVFENTLQRDLSESGPHYFRSQRSEQHETPTN